MLGFAADARMCATEGSVNIELWDSNFIRKSLDEFGSDWSKDVLSRRNPRSTAPKKNALVHSPVPVRAAPGIQSKKHIIVRNIY